MVVRIRLVQLDSRVPRREETALALAALLTPSALIAFTISVWNIAADLRWTTNFFISRGPFSHWQTWLLAAALLLLLARLLQRFAENGRNLAE